jgi:hypothetical protein
MQDPFDEVMTSRFFLYGGNHIGPPLLIPGCIFSLSTTALLENIISGVA